MKRLLIVIGCLVLTALALTAWDAYRAHQQVSEICSRAQAGMPVADFIKTIDRVHFKVVSGRDQTFVVSRSGFGRHLCAISHDGERIGSARTAFLD